MKKFFGRDKPKVARVTPVPKEITTGLVSNASEEQQLQYHPQSSSDARRAISKSREAPIRSSSEDLWEVVPSNIDPTNQQTTARTPSFPFLPPGTSPSVQSPTPRSSSPFSVVSNPPLSSHQIGAQRDRETSILKKKPPASSVAALGILKALDPQTEPTSQRRSRSDEHLAQAEQREEKKEKRSFWERTSVRDKERERDRMKERDRRDEEIHDELTRMIGYLTATASEDWSLVLEVCDRASANEASAREAVRALRREFKYGEPPAQLSAARLWAIMLRNSSDIFVSQSMSRKFLDTIEEMLMSPRTSPVVRERLVDIVGAAAYASGTKGKGDKDGFRGLWRRIRPADKPEIGMPFYVDDAMFIPPASVRVPRPSNDTILPLTDPSRPPPTQPKRKSPFSHDRIIPLEEDMRRLLQECRLGQGNAALLTESLAFAKPEDLTKKDIIKEFHLKCCSSQELIFAQIPWATAGAEQSRLNRAKTDEATGEPTMQEQLLAELLAANEALLEALRVYDDLESLANERRVEERSRREVTTKGAVDTVVHGHSSSAMTHDDSSRPPSPSSSSGQSDSMSSATPPGPRFPPNLETASMAQAALAQSLAPPPPAPHGPRSPVQLSISSRPPSPVVPRQHSRSSSVQSRENGNAGELGRANSDSGPNDDDNSHINVYDQPSAKALGKRKVVDADDVDHSLDEDAFLEPKDEFHGTLDRDHAPWQYRVQYVYDAAAERTEQRIRDAKLVNLVNGVH